MKFRLKFRNAFNAGAQKSGVKAAWSRDGGVKVLELLGSVQGRDASPDSECLSMGILVQI